MAERDRRKEKKSIGALLAEKMSHFLKCLLIKENSKIMKYFLYIARSFLMHVHRAYSDITQ